MAGFRTKFCLLWSKQEGFGAPGTVPTRKHNPGDLRHSPHSSHVGEGPNDIGEIDNDQDGIDDQERQAQLFAERGLTIQEAVYTICGFIPGSNTTECDGNDPAEYLKFMCAGLGLAPDVAMVEALKIPA